jgi:hypothetical protein
MYDYVLSFDLVENADGAGTSGVWQQWSMFLAVHATDWTGMRHLLMGTLYGGSDSHLENARVQQTRRLQSLQSKPGSLHAP